MNAESCEHLHDRCTLVDEVPIDSRAAAMSVIVKDKADKHFLISKGAVAETLSVCTSIAHDDQYQALTSQKLDDVKTVARDMNDDGFRALALGVREIEHKAAYSRDDEKDLTMMGFIAFLDPPKRLRGRGDQGLERQRRRREDPHRRQRHRHAQRVPPGRYTSGRNT